MIKKNLNNLLSSSALSIITASLLLAGTVNAATKEPMADKKIAEEAKLAAQIPKIIANGDKEISRRLEALNNLIARIGQMQKLSDAQKANVTGKLQSFVDAMNSLKTKIDADTDIATLRTDIKSIVDSYRVFALVMPQSQIYAAADRIGTLIDTMNAVVPKIQTEISTAQAAGKDVTVLQSALTDLTAKLADATTQYQAAQSGVANLAPDQGDKTVMDSNLAALKKARADIKVATIDIIAARKDMEKIHKAYKAFKLPAPAAASSTEPAPAN